VGRLPGSNRLNLAIGLPLRNQAELNGLLEQLYDPASPQYRHYLTLDQFTERFGATKEDYDAVTAFAKVHGLTITGIHPNRTLLDISGSVADIEMALHVKLQVYQHPTEARTFHAPDVEPTVDLAVPVLHISGLDNFNRILPLGRRAPRGPGRRPKSLTGSGPGGAFMGNDFRAAYLPGVTLTGAGQSVALLEFDGYYPSDITDYESLAGLTNVPLQKCTGRWFRREGRRQQRRDGIGH
jgi:subtilase family serine protease